MQLPRGYRVEALPNGKWLLHDYRAQMRHLCASEAEAVALAFRFARGGSR